MQATHRGSCLCGSVHFEVDGAIDAPDACHCKQCRKQSGHYFASGSVKRKALTVHGAEHVKWYQSSDKVRRGFCGNCGSALFWDPLSQQHDWTGIAMGALDTSTGLQLHCHIFVSEKGDYYQISDGLPQHAR
jgi:hypothetical protein